MILRARLLALTGGVAVGLATGFSIAATVIGFAGSENPTLSFDASRRNPRAFWVQSLLIGAAAAITYSVVIAPLERRLEAANRNAGEAKVAGFAVLGLVAGVVVGALGTIVAHGRW